ncbi:MAG TPA: hypothetical protein VFN61_15150, partial [Acidimicrobiales bacterium]|nr:hypothetical protein [Acidimicrobiales bacterium]
MNRQAVLGCALALVMLAACGTTVPVRAEGGPGAVGASPGDRPSTTLGGVASSGTVAGGYAVGPAAPSASAGGGNAAATTGTGSSYAAGSSSPGAGAASSAPRPATTGSEAAVQGGTITIGALTAEGAGAYERQLGFSGVATGDQAALTTAVVNYINAHGGIAGHRVRLLIYDVKAQDAATNPSSAYQAACAFFTQDNHVAAVASYLSLVPANFYSCLQQAGVVVTTPDEEFSAAFLSEFANTVVEPNAPSYTRLMADSVDALWSAGWLTGQSKVGVVAFDTPDGHSSVDAGLVPALQRHGLRLADSFYTSTDTSAYGQYAGPVLRFKAEGIDRVFFAIGGEPAIFALAAEQ